MAITSECFYVPLLWLSAGESGLEGRCPLMHAVASSPSQSLQPVLALISSPFLTPAASNHANWRVYCGNTERFCSHCRLGQTCADKRNFQTYFLTPDTAWSDGIVASSVDKFCQLLSFLGCRHGVTQYQKLMEKNP